MIFGNPTEFAIEVYHEPSGPGWGGCGRMAVEIQGVRLGDIRENHCSLFGATDRFRELNQVIETLWDDSFAGLSHVEIFNLLDNALYLGEPDLVKAYFRFDFLTNTGEMFDNYKSFIACSPEGRVHVLYKKPSDETGAVSCSVQTFSLVADSYVSWFDEQIRNVGPPFFAINPFDLNEKVAKAGNA